MTFNELLESLRAGGLPNLTQNEMLLILAEEIRSLQEDYESHRHYPTEGDVSSLPT